MSLRRPFLSWLSLLTGLCLATAAFAATVPAGTTARVTLLETTDLHSHILSYDYYKLTADPHVGLERTATLIRRARAKYPNTLLFDDGDTIQGSVLADYQALAHPVPCDRELAIYRAMDTLGYAAGTIGNHEFNYGLPFLAQVTDQRMHVTGVKNRRCAGPHFPLVLSNVFSTENGQPIYRPWRVIEKTVTATTPDGQTVRVPLRIGVLGFAPPPIMQWDKRHLKGNVTVMGVVDAARKYLPQLQAQHPDLIVALVHGGLDDSPYTPKMENAGWYLAKDVPAIDALLLGHQHQAFPGPHFKGMPGVDAERGTVHGMPAVMGGFFGKDLGVIHLKLVRKDGRWVSDRAAARSQVLPICAGKTDCVPTDPHIAPRVAAVQKATVAYVNTPIGHTDFRMTSVFADLGNVSALSIVNAAQRDYVKHWIAENRPDLKGVPVLSAAAAFRTGFGGPDDYTDVPPGALTLRSAADLYYYPNTLAAVRVDGAGLKAWLEHAAQRFRRIDPSQSKPQALINPNYTGYNFDQIQGGVHYRIDVSQPVGQRIRDLTFNGKPVRADQTFIVATNNYRASGGGHFPGLDGHATVLDAPDANREILVQWIRAHPHVTRADFGPRPWQFVPLKTKGPVTIIAPTDALNVTRGDHVGAVRKLHDDGNGLATYAIDLSKK
ncbi:bifunctional 2',3'-cyclic-nucleotide 2'-phosphodiesterase/3'-nucleotidase [Oleiagrimonas sp. MCCC 1A03011]|uniref:bifunctional 2',3'-cyclic-nucleotide 2'-phosphodiesterase/3'-nucleotidase n=1 Tax=Oleiagrimonas sp. MCCC 1A03011 TaxID=1926883 RepID=UPI000DC2BB04|nr:bifunctional 2',3'-cyclic-nucleotide 2'-phosphodiesterase/3'-nucleotidase [Oleiagrimonas sp. MCCC 1A03011]RAP56189.1 2',3'-cyclic-nucleotide 2'-phosphodiesterase [Oleiagrimonas sp. MCCC 1A03011]